MPDWNPSGGATAATCASVKSAAALAAAGAGVGAAAGGGAGAARGDAPPGSASDASDAATRSAAGSGRNATFIVPATANRPHTYLTRVGRSACSGQERESAGDAGSRAARADSLRALCAPRSYTCACSSASALGRMRKRRARAVSWSLGARWGASWCGRCHVLRGTGEMLCFFGLEKMHLKRATRTAYLDDNDTSVLRSEDVLLTKYGCRGAYEMRAHRGNIRICAEVPS